MPDYNLLGSTEVLEELQSGRTRELLLLLQDRPVPQVQDPPNLQSSLSVGYGKDQDGDYTLSETIYDRQSDDKTFTGQSYKAGIGIKPNINLSVLEGEISQNTGNVTKLYVLDSSGNTTLADKSISASSGDVVSIEYDFTKDTEYYIVVDDNGSNYDFGVKQNANKPSLDAFNVHDFYRGGIGATDGPAFTKISSVSIGGYVTDNFSVNSDPPTDFSAWHSIRAIDVTNGGSTSPDPVEFEILDSSDTVLNSTRIPKARIADEPFTMRNRVYSEDAGSDGQSDYTISTTGDGGHFGIPVLAVVSVKKNGSVLDSANWSFDSDTYTVTIDTSSVTIASGDTIGIKYDFDVFDPTMQPRAYLNRESSSETSPSISHFRYEYVI